MCIVEKLVYFWFNEFSNRWYIELYYITSTPKVPDNCSQCNAMICICSPYTITLFNVQCAHCRENNNSMKMMAIKNPKKNEMRALVRRYWAIAVVAFICTIASFIFAMIFYCFSVFVFFFFGWAASQPWTLTMTRTKEQQAFFIRWDTKRETALNSTRLKECFARRLRCFDSFPRFQYITNASLGSMYINNIRIMQARMNIVLWCLCSCLPSNHVAVQYKCASAVAYWLLCVCTDLSNVRMT